MRKILSALVMFFGLVSFSDARTHVTFFDSTENPISESSSWTNGSGNWGGVRTTTNQAFGISQPTQFGDPTAVVSGTWGASQWVLGVIKIVSTPGACCHEVELRVRTAITAGNINGYEVLVPVHASPGYGLQIVRWNGANGQFVYLFQGSAFQGQNGDVMFVTASGTNPTTITATVYRNGSVVTSGTGVDHGTETGPGGAAGPWTGGNPGIGFYDNQDSNWSAFGWSQFIASDQPIRIAASASTANVQTQITASSPGDTVFVPASAGTAWTSLSISGINLIGANNTTSGTVITAGTVNLTKHASQTTRLSGFRFTGTDVHAVVTGIPTARSYIINDNYFFSSTNDFFDLNANGGIVHHNQFFMNPSSAGGPDVMMIHPNESWSQAVTFGTGDTQGPVGGERNIYFEDNTFTNCLETCPDGDQGARLVIRHNTYVDSSIVFHSGGPVNDTSTDGTRQYEVYSNTFSRVNANNNVNKWIWSRGGSGVIANNSMDIVSSSQFGNKVQINLGIGCEGSPSYPIVHQQGQSTAPSTENPPSHPVLIFGNTGPGSSGSSFLVITGNDSGGGGHTCSTPGTYVQQNRDYYLSNQWGWTAFTYPHPLALDTSGASNPGNPGINISPLAGFGTQKVGTTATPQSLTVTSNGTQDLVIASIVKGGTNSGDFTVSHNCPIGTSLTSSSTCQITVGFTPTATGARSGTITVTSNAPTSPDVVSMSGTGTAPSISLTPASRDFGSIVTGTTSSGLGFLLQNSGDASATISSIGLTGSTDFAQSNNCGATLAPSSSCTITVTLHPSTDGVKSGGVSVSDDASGSPHTATLAGTGVPASGPGTLVINGSGGVTITGGVVLK